VSLLKYTTDRHCERLVVAREAVDEVAGEAKTQLVSYLVHQEWETLQNKSSHVVSVVTGVHISACSISHVYQGKNGWGSQKVQNLNIITCHILTHLSTIE
jgi:hypothetical protein